MLETDVIRASSTPAANFRMLRVTRPELVLAGTDRNKGTHTNTPRHFLRVVAVGQTGCSATDQICTVTRSMCLTHHVALDGETTKAQIGGSWLHRPGTWYTQAPRPACPAYACLASRCKTAASPCSGAPAVAPARPEVSPGASPAARARCGAGPAAEVRLTPAIHNVAQSHAQQSAHSSERNGHAAKTVLFVYGVRIWGQLGSPPPHSTCPGRLAAGLM